MSRFLAIKNGRKIVRSFSLRKEIKLQPLPWLGESLDHLRYNLFVKR